jgi:hypothetical protein
MSSLDLSVAFDIVNIVNKSPKNWLTRWQNSSNQRVIIKQVLLPRFKW